MKIYFAGSIRGGRNDAKLYLEFIEFLKGFGEVLTEHLGDLNLTHLGDDGVTDRFIHDRDVSWLLSADVLVAEVTVVSMGVGYEIGRAVSAGKKIICLYRQTPDKKLSAMISGCSDVTLIVYDNIKEAKDRISFALNNFSAAKRT
jgi:2'-deoxynucleoside 5'-phosphate N-hydrolase